MARHATFEGFPREALKFLKGIERHNDRDWFERHRAEYEACLLDPARAFVEALGRRLRRLVPGIRVEPRIDGSILRMHRDTRFSRDKSPYRTWLGLSFWEGDGPAREHPGFFLQLSASELSLDAGLHRFTREQLAAYREAAADPETGKALRRALRRVTAKGAVSIVGERFKRVPRGLDPEHVNADLLRHDGLFARRAGLPTRPLLGERAVDSCYSVFRELAPVQRWLAEMLG